MPKVELDALKMGAAPVGPLSSFRQLGKSGLRVSPVCLGAMALGENWSRLLGETTQDEAKRIFNRYCDLGGRAMMYFCGRKVTTSRSSEH